MVYPDSFINCLKQTLLQRKDNGYRFTRDDITYIRGCTRLTKGKIEKWAERVRAKYSAEKLVAFLKTEKKYKVFLFKPAWITVCR